MSDKEPAVICDLDGTLALMGDRSPYDASQSHRDKLNQPIASIVKRFAKDHEIIIVSGRSDRWLEQTQDWLQRHQVPYDQLYLRKEADSRRDTVYKQEIWEEKIKGKYQVLFVLEDRQRVVNFYRELGLTCLQVAPGDF